MSTVSYVRYTVPRRCGRAQYICHGLALVLIEGRAHFLCMTGRLFGKYIGNGLFVRCCAVLYGDFAVKKKSSGPQMCIDPRVKQAPLLAGIIVEVVTWSILQVLADADNVSIAC